MKLSSVIFARKADAGSSEENASGQEIGTLFRFQRKRSFGVGLIALAAAAILWPVAGEARGMGGAAFMMGHHSAIGAMHMHMPRHTAHFDSKRRLGRGFGGTALPYGGVDFGPGPGVEDAAAFGAGPPVPIAYPLPYPWPGPRMCSQPRLIALENTKRQRHLPRVVYGTPPACPAPGVSG